MNRILFLFLLSFIAVSAFSQSTLPLTADTIKVYKRDGTPAELVIKNGTKDTIGFLFNTGGGKTVFRRGIIKLSDTAFLIGADTLYTSGITTNSFNNITSLDDTTILIQRGNGISDTIVIAGNGGGGSGVPCYGMEIIGNADSLGGKPASFYLDYNNLTNQPDLSSFAAVLGLDTALQNLRVAIAAKPDTIDLIIDNVTIKGDGSVSSPLHVNDSILNGKLNVADTTAKWVNSITKNATGDSIVFYIGAVRYAIKDSTAGAGNGMLLGSYTSTQRDAISNPVVGSQLFNTTNGWWEYYDAFWGWMPVSISTEWKLKYGTEWHDPLSSGASQFIARANGTGAGIDYNGSTAWSPYGYARMATGTTTTGSEVLHTQTGGSSPGYVLGKGMFSFSIFNQLVQLSNATDEFQVLIGLQANNVAGLSTAINNGAFFLYDRVGANPWGIAGADVWQCVTMTNGVATVTPTNVTVSTGAAKKLQVLVNANASQYTFKINDVVVATHTTNLPAVNVTYRLNAGIYKSAGTTSVTMGVWDAMFKEKFNTPR